MKNINSLKNTPQFKEVYENGKSCANRILVLYMMENGLEERRLGISVSKRVGNSVVRHRVTRLIRESFVRLEKEIPAGYSCVVVARPWAARACFSDIYDALIYLSGKILKNDCN